jgi:LacI family transcriptional regulator
MEILYYHGVDAGPKRDQLPMKKPKKAVTIHDIAKRANVSVATVSNVLNNKETVDSTIRQTVREIAQQLNYRSPIKRSGSAERLHKMIAMISADVTDAVMNLIFKGAENSARIHGYTSILCDSENSRELEQEHIASLLGKGIEGLLLIPSGEEIEQVGHLCRNGYPLVVVDRKIRCPQASHVISDNLAGAYQATKYLLSLGHTRIMYLAGRRKVSTEVERFEGYQKALQEQGIALAGELIVPGEFDWAVAYDKVDEAVRRGVRFTAIFAANDPMAFAAKEAIEKNGLRMNEDISIVGYNDNLDASAISLTTVAIDPLDMGKNAVLLLFDLISKRRTPPQEIVLHPRLVIRNSCRMMA